MYCRLSSATLSLLAFPKEIPLGQDSCTFFFKWVGFLDRIPHYVWSWFSWYVSTLWCSPPTPTSLGNSSILWNFTNTYLPAWPWSLSQLYNDNPPVVKTFSRQQGFDFWKKYLLTSYVFVLSIGLLCPTTALCPGQSVWAWLPWLRHPCGCAVSFQRPQQSVWQSAVTTACLTVLWCRASQSEVMGWLILRWCPDRCLKWRWCVIFLYSDFLSVVVVLKGWSQA